MPRPGPQMALGSVEAFDGYDHALPVRPLPLFIGKQLKTGGCREIQLRGLKSNPRAFPGGSVPGGVHGLPGRQGGRAAGDLTGID